jgi:hypothetical protein
MYLHEVAIYCHSSEWLVQRLMELGIIGTETHGDDEFLQPADLEIIQKAARLEHDFGVNPEGIDIILHMRNQLSALRREVELLKRYYSQFDRHDLHFLDSNE